MDYFLLNRELKLKKLDLFFYIYKSHDRYFPIFPVLPSFLSISLYHSFQCSRLDLPSVFLLKNCEWLSTHTIQEEYFSSHTHASHMRHRVILWVWRHNWPCEDTQTHIIWAAAVWWRLLHTLLVVLLHSKYNKISEEESLQLAELLPPKDEKHF